MSGATRVDHVSLRTAAVDVRSVRADVDGLLRQLRGVVTQDLGPAWQGAAAGAFQKLMERWDADARDVQEALSAIADLLDTSAVTHQVNDEEQQAVLDKIHAALSPGR
ncbi:MAG: WXG100 family type VII secretion target [Longispora sp.]|nr:WXG100 family type VII secretion target [Longispora sp. (in: high G+C Gram-positive bacteria)]